MTEGKKTLWLLQAKNMQNQKKEKGRIHSIRGFKRGSKEY